MDEWFAKDIAVGFIDRINKQIDIICEDMLEKVSEIPLIAENLRKNKSSKDLTADILIEIHDNISERIIDLTRIYRMNEVGTYYDDVAREVKKKNKERSDTLRRYKNGEFNNI